MSIKHAIVHELLRNSTTSDMTLSAQALEPDDLLTDLFTGMKTAFYNRTSKQYGQFSEDSGHFKALVGQWANASIGFVTLTEQIMKQFQLAIEQAELDFTGHWIFVAETLEEGEHFWFFHLRHRHGVSLTHDQRISASKLVDFGKLGFGGYVDLAALADQAQKYLTVSFGFGERQLQALLLDCVDFVDTINTAVDTERFMEIVKAYSETLPQEKGANYRKKAIEYCTEQDKVGETVVADEISVVLSDEVGTEQGESLVHYMTQTAPEAKREFIPDRKSLKKYQRYSGKSREVSISFTNESLGGAVSFDAQAETLTISQLPEALLKQLKAALE